MAKAPILPKKNYLPQEPLIFSEKEYFFGTSIDRATESFHEFPCRP